jgi:uncharacterized protein with HEPN domain
MLNCAAKTLYFARDYEDPWEFYHAQDQAPFDAAQMLLGVIGEQIPKLAESLKTKYDSIPWRQVRSVRNIIFHDYSGVDYREIFRIIKEDLPEFKEQVAYIIRTECAEGTFDRQEIELVRHNEYYRFIDFDALR